MKWFLDACKEHKDNRYVMATIATSMGEVEVSYFNPYSLGDDMDDGDIADLLTSISCDCDYYDGIIGSVSFYK